ncbi:Hypothetical predicted protein [Podarcis lilfordi]|uniref:Uncharacterized protein n=1 Tax=Podarcis lilfordi TaxID=74358 RepID=A0AA35LIX7_9SAUR|nr:Hypothetical predicted protein [Podarcis lilfordi]
MEPSAFPSEGVSGSHHCLGTKRPRWASFAERERDPRICRGVGLDDPGVAPPVASAWLLPRCPRGLQPPFLPSFLPPEAKERRGGAWAGSGRSPEGGGGLRFVRGCAGLPRRVRERKEGGERRRAWTGGGRSSSRDRTFISVFNKEPECLIVVCPEYQQDSSRSVECL